ncbi:MAG: hypothetical protein KBT32_04255 [Bacteroidales bacterium]|nr:hypothetical protein [Candidatus Physcocola equi]
MSEYELYNRILAPRLRCKSQTVLFEESGCKMHKADVIADSKIAYSLYRYDQKEHGDLFFPFFNNTHDGDLGSAEIPTPADLLKFCDYILLAEKRGVLYVLLIELKSGDNGDAYKQLDASAAFMEYIKNTAVRISETNGYLEFDENNVKLRKIVLKPSPKIRPFTNKAKSKHSEIDLNASPIYYCSDMISLNLFCRQK